jgi:hypothetical protein
MPLATDPIALRGNAIVSSRSPQIFQDRGPCPDTKTLSGRTPMTTKRLLLLHPPPKKSPFFGGEPIAWEIKSIEARCSLAVVLGGLQFDLAHLGSGAVGLRYV